MKKNIFNIALALTLGLGATSCNDWLDVKPSDQVEDTELFETEAGFKEALAGVYSAMLSEGSYKKDMLYGAVGVLAHEWTSSPTNYTELSNYNYDATYSENIFSGIWSANYNAIANANNVLKYIDDHRAVFHGNNYSIIKGEALALRAFLHFDLLRCFGVSYAVNKEMPAIPYADDVTYKVFPQLTVEQVAKKVLDDLNAAEELLKDKDPICTGEEITEMNDKGYLMNRQVHMNYYAVKALQARVYMWTQDYTNARLAAAAVLAATGDGTGKQPFSWTQSDEFIGKLGGLPYSTMAHEHIFGLNDLNMYTISNNYFNDNSTVASFTVSTDDRATYYNNETVDLRYLYFFDQGTNDVTAWYLKKYKVPTPVGQNVINSYYTYKLPLIRVAEMLLIKSECNYRLDTSDPLNAGIAGINELRNLRGLADITSTEVDEVGGYYNYLIREYRRELIGEGQLWFLYKRLHNDNILGYSSDDGFDKRNYTFPIPQSETEMAERKENR